MAGSKNVLIVEDDVMIRDLYRVALVSAQYTVEIAGDAEATYEKLKTYHPDYVFLDIMLRGETGLEILKELRTNPAHGCMHGKIVMLTNLAQQSATDTAIEYGADGYVIKADITPSDLTEVIASLDE